MLTEKVEEAFDLLVEGMLEEGQQILSDALSHQHMTDELRYAIAENYHALGFLEEALELMTNLALKYPHEPECQLYYIELLIEAGKDEEALDTIYIKKDIFTAKEDHIHYTMLLADLYMGQGLPEVAEERLKELLQIYPSEQLIHTALAEIYYQMEKYQAAIEHIHQGTEYTSYAMLADCYAHVGRFEEALEEYKHAVTAEAPTAELYFSYGYVALQLKELDIAIDKLKYAIELEPHFVKVYPLLIESLIEQQAHAEALEYIQQGLKYDTTNAQLFYLAARLTYIVERDSTKAFEYAQKALALDDQHTATLTWMKDYYLGQSEWEEALKLIDQILENHPQQGDLWEEKGDVLEELEQPEEAETAYKTALQIDESNTELLNKLGYLYRNLGNLQEAVRCWQKSVILDPNQLEIIDILEDYA